MNRNSIRIRAGNLDVAGVESGLLGIRSQLAQRQQDRAAQKIAPDIAHMLQHVNEPFRIATLVALSGVSTSHFFSLFKTVTGSTPIGFFIRLRMQRACELLQDRNVRVKEAATMLGYDDPCYFSRIFKLATGVAPRNYREQILNPTSGGPDAPPTNGGKRPCLTDVQLVPSKTFPQRNLNGGRFQRRDGRPSPSLANAC